MSISLEDSWLDVLSKARVGHGLSDAGIAASSGLGITEVQNLMAGKLELDHLSTVASVLGLDPSKLKALASGEYLPAEISLNGLWQFVTPFGEMMVNSYLISDPASKSAVAFDTGSDCDDLLGILDSERLDLKLILLTHSHGDHVLDLDRLVEKTGASAWIGEAEQLEGAHPFAAGHEFIVGSLKVQTRLTWGHSPGGITYVVSGLPLPVALVGDAMFAGSIGGGRVSYTDALRTNREQILNLPESTVICPGHGPMTTVGEQVSANPFF